MHQRADDTVNALFPVKDALPGRVHETKRLREDVRGVVYRRGQSVGDVGPREQKY